MSWYSRQPYRLHLGQALSLLSCFTLPTTSLPAWLLLLNKSTNHDSTSCETSPNQSSWSFISIYQNARYNRAQITLLSQIPIAWLWWDCWSWATRPWTWPQPRRWKRVRRHWLGSIEWLLQANSASFMDRRTKLDMERVMASSRLCRLYRVRALQDLLLQTENQVLRGLFDLRNHAPPTKSSLNRPRRLVSRPATNTTWKTANNDRKSHQSEQS